MFYHDTQGQVSYFSVEDDLESTSNDFLERLIDQLSRHDEEEMRLRRTLERQLRMNNGEDRRAEEAKEKMIQLINATIFKSGI